MFVLQINLWLNIFLSCILFCPFKSFLGILTWKIILTYLFSNRYFSNQVFFLLTLFLLIILWPLHFGWLFRNFLSWSWKEWFLCQVIHRVWWIRKMICFFRWIIVSFFKTSKEIFRHLSFFLLFHPRLPKKLSIIISFVFHIGLK